MPADSVTETDNACGQCHRTDNACGQCHRNRQCLRTVSQKQTMPADSVTEQTMPADSVTEQTMPADSVTETDNANSFSLSTESPFLEIDADRKLIPLVSALQQVHTRFYKLDDV